MYSAAACAQTPLLEAGVWIDDSGNGAVEIYVCQDRADRLCGRIVWLKEPLNAQGLPKRDRHNPKESLQTRPICGLPVLGNLARVSEGGFDGGWIYDPKAGKSYSAAIQLARKDKLTVTGYVGLKFLSKSFVWTRAPLELARCEGAPEAAPGSQAAAKPAPDKAKKPAATAATVAAPKPAATVIAPANAATAARAELPATSAVPAAAPSPKPAVKPAKAAAAPSAVPPPKVAAKPAAAAAKPATAQKPAPAATTATAEAETGPAQAPLQKPAKKPVMTQQEYTSMTHGAFGWSED